MNDMVSIGQIIGAVSQGVVVGWRSRERGYALCSFDSLGILMELSPARFFYLIILGLRILRDFKGVCAGECISSCGGIRCCLVGVVGDGCENCFRFHVADVLRLLLGRVVDSMQQSGDTVAQNRG